MAETEKSDKKPPILLVVLAPTEKKLQQHQPAALQLVSLWALFNAIVAAATFAVSYTLSKTTGADDDDDDALVVGYVCCSVLQAAVAALALLVASHRRALAYVALTLAVASHCIFAGFVADDAPGPLFLKVGGTLAAVTFAAGDLLCVLALLRGGEE